MFEKTAGSFSSGSDVSVQVPHGRRRAGMKQRVMMCCDVCLRSMLFSRVLGMLAVLIGSKFCCYARCSRCRNSFSVACAWWIHRVFCSLHQNKSSLSRETILIHGRCPTTPLLLQSHVLALVCIALARFTLSHLPAPARSNPFRRRSLTLLSQFCANFCFFSGYPYMGVEFANGERNYTQQYPRRATLCMQAVSH